MTKRAKATKQEKRLIKEWLQNPFEIIAESCPFSTVLIFCPLEASPYCKKFFPKLKDRCPCHKYPIKYVKRVARELIR